MSTLPPAPPSLPQPTLDTSPRGLMRLYYRLVLVTGLAILGVHTALGFMHGSPGKAGWFLLALDGLVLVVAYLGLELERDGIAPRRKVPLAALPAAIGVVVSALCFETGGLASPFFMVVLSTCIFAALTFPMMVSILVVALVGACYAFCAWVSPPDGFLRGGVEAIVAAVQGGRNLQPEQTTTLVVNCLFLFVGSLVAMHMSRGYRANLKGLQESASKDPLTTLLNRRGFVQTMRGEISRAQRFSWPVGLLMIDLDHFKRINDQHGHPFGDAVLKASAKLLREAAGPVDHLARVGGEEFSVAAMGADAAHAGELAQRILRTFRSHDWSSLLPGLKVTCSIGIAVLEPGKPMHGDVEAVLGRLMAEADRGLYLAKQQGRDTYRLAEDAPLDNGLPPAPPSTPSGERRSGGRAF